MIMAQEITFIEVNRQSARQQHISKVNTKPARVKRNSRKKRVRILRMQIGCIVFLLLLLAAFFGIQRFLESGQGHLPDRPDRMQNEKVQALLNEIDVPQDIAELLWNNEETYEFVKNYPDREDYKNQSIDLAGEAVNGKAPLLMQWDMRWGYNEYGDSIIALSGCGPTCLSMAYIYLTGDTSKNPREMAEYAQANGYYTAAGTSWALWTDGAADLGLCGTELSLDKNVMKRRLDDGNVIVCSMRPGDFTTTGHFILIYGYDENGFLLNDPNRRSNSEKVWDYETLSRQIKNLWSIGL